MKRSIYLLLLLAILSAVSGILLSNASWIGRVGITFLHKEYNFLKIWWQGAIGVFLVYLALFLLHDAISRKLSVVPAKMIHGVVLLLTIGGYYLTQDDFTHTLSHRLLGWKFHYGIYLFWAGWAIICLYFLLKPRVVKLVVTDTGKMVSEVH